MAFLTSSKQLPTRSIVEFQIKQLIAHKGLGHVFLVFIGKKSCDITELFLNNLRHTYPAYFDAAANDLIATVGLRKKGA